MTTLSSLSERLVGRQFNKLRVLAVHHVQYGARGRWTYKAECECECGTHRSVYAYALLGGHTGSCGCDKSKYAKMTGAAHYRFKGFGEIRAGFWSGYKEGAKRRGIEWALGIEDAWALYRKQGGRCALTGIPLVFGVGRNGNTTASLDRIDANQGYVKDNVQWVHKRINVMRNTMGVEEFVQWCALVVAHAGSSCAGAST